MSKPSPQKLKSGLIVIISSFIIVYVASFNHTIKNLAYASYYWLFKFDHFSSGDKVYASTDCMNQKQYGAIGLFRLMRPLTPDELKFVDQITEPNLHIDKTHIDSNAKPILVSCNKYLLKEKMKIQHSAYVGDYIRFDYLPIAAAGSGRKQSTVNAIFYAIKPNLGILTNIEINRYTLPANYTWADSTFYIMPFDVSNKEYRM